LLIGDHGSKLHILHLCAFDDCFGTYGYFYFRKFRLLDHPGQRKIHIHYISRLGGVAIFLSIWLSVLFLSSQELISLQSSFWSSIFFGSLAAFMLGLWDDLKNISAKKKLAFQIGLAFLAYNLGFRIDEIELGLGHSVHFGSFHG
jgi:UDP-GlcNAc:undecaprenyl-phosphate GlcNAc-1-phosphate transferase